MVLTSVPCYLFCRYRLRAKVDIENVAEELHCWQRYGGKLSEKASSIEEPEAGSVGWGGGVDRLGISASHGEPCGWQWFKDPRLDCLGFRGIFPSNTTRELCNPLLLCRVDVLHFIASQAFLLVKLFFFPSLQHLWLKLTKKQMNKITFYGEL